MPKDDHAKLEETTELFFKLVGDNLAPEHRKMLKVEKTGPLGFSFKYRGSGSIPAKLQGAFTSINMMQHHYSAYIASVKPKAKDKDVKQKDISGTEDIRKGSGNGSK